MEVQKIVNFLDITSDDKKFSKFITKKWIEFYDQLEKNYSPNKKIRIKTSMLRSDLCDYSNSYIVVKGNIIANKKHLLLTTLKNQIIQQLMLLLLILQMIIRLVKKIGF